MAHKTNIPLDFATLRKNYPTYRDIDSGKPPFQQPAALMKSIKSYSPKSTPCCIQVSHALNKAGIIIPSASSRRANAKQGEFYYLLAVDELANFLTAEFGFGQDVKRDAAGKVRKTIADMKAAMTGRTGIICFRDDATAGRHTELWDGKDIVQNGAPLASGAAMDQGYCFAADKVLFWEVSDTPAPSMPAFLPGWWEVYDGSTYYYYFSGQGVVTWTQSLPFSLASPPPRTPSNEGDMEVNLYGVSTITWDPRGDGQTIETFTPSYESLDKMNGESNRFSPLVATKLTDQRLTELKKPKKR